MRRSRRGGESCTEILVDAVAEKKDVEPTTLPPLYDVVDPDHLEGVIETTDVPVHVEFQYCGCLVVIDGDGNVTVTEHPADEPATDV